MRLGRVQGFTLVEVLVVIVIIGVLIALLLPAVQGARESGRRTQCTNHLKQVGLALHGHHDARKTFPPGGITDGPCCNTKSFGNWAIYILPYLEQQSTFDRYSDVGGLYPPAEYDDGGFLCVPLGLDHNEDTANRTVREMFIPYYTCPADVQQQKLMVPESGPGNKLGLKYMTGSYRANSGRSDACGWFDMDQAACLPFRWRGPLHTVCRKPLFCSKVGRSLQMESTATILDGVSNTLMLGEYYTVTRPTRTTFWAYTYGSYSQSSVVVDSNRSLLPDYDKCEAAGGLGGNNTCKRGWGSLHPGGLNFLMGDGSVRFINRNIAMIVLGEAATMAGGEPTQFSNF